MSTLALLTIDPVCFTVCSKPEVTPHLARLGKVPKSIHDDLFEPKQVLAVYKVPGFERDTFASLARRYKLEGSSPERLCEVNARVSRTLPW